LEQELDFIRQGQDPHALKDTHDKEKKALERKIKSLEHKLVSAKEAHDK